MKQIFYLAAFFPFVLFAQPDLTFTPMVFDGTPDAISEPVDITGSGDGTNRLYLVQKIGTVRIIEEDTLNNDFFLQIDDSQVQNNGERGLLGLVFHPNYPDPAFRYCYVNYVTPQPWTTRIARFEVNAEGTAVVPNSEVIFLEVPQPYGNHNGGDLAFGPNDGYLYIGMGDGGSGGDPQNRAQNKNTLIGKMLRIDVDQPDPIAETEYSIPSDNPFVGDPSILDEIWSFGIRNPWRFSFDRENGDMWIADVGQNEWEEINRVPNDGGENYGWKCFEGDTSFADVDCSTGNLTFPVFAYPHDDPDVIPDGWDLGIGNSVTGGFVYRGSKWPSLRGYYICADFVSNYAWLIREDENLLATEVEPLNLNNVISNVSTFGEGDDGEMYMLDFSGTLYRVESDDPLAVESIALKAISKDDEVAVSWKIYDASDDDAGARLILERSPDGHNFEQLFDIDYNTQVTQFMDREPLSGLNYYRLRYLQSGEKDQLSNIEVVRKGEEDFFTLVSTNGGQAIQLQVNAHSSPRSLGLFTTNGHVVFQQSFSANDLSLFKTIEVNGFGPGIYFIQMDDGQTKQVEKIVIR